METKTNVLSLLGLALRGKRLVVGEEPVEGAARARDARVLLLASDAAENTVRRCRHFAEAGQCLWLSLPFTKEELGRAVGRSSAAILAVTDVGLAASLVHKLELLDPAKYSAAAQRLDLKAKRAAERRAELEAHRKNLREGKRRPKAEPDQAPQGGRSAGEQQPERRPQPGRGPGAFHKPCSGKPGSAGTHSRPAKGRRPKPRANENPYAHSRPVKKGKGSFRKKEQ